MLCQPRVECGRATLPCANDPKVNEAWFVGGLQRGEGRGGVRSGLELELLREPRR
jgi:hypothetical protein